MSLTLYHGSSGNPDLVGSILKDGLKPSWDGFTYLALEKAASYACCRSYNYCKNTVGSIFKIEIDENILYPDADYMLIFQGEKSIEVQKQSRHLWKESLEKFGQVAVLGGISKKSILAHRTVDFTKWEERLIKLQLQSSKWITQKGNKKIVNWNAQKKLCRVFKMIMELAFEGELE